MSQEFWDRKFAGDAYQFGTEPARFLVRNADKLPQSGHALAIADGEGRNGVWLAEQGLSVTSQDISPVGQQKARALAEARGVSLTFTRTDLLTWEMPQEAFDVVAAIFWQFAGPAERDRVFQALTSALAPGGLLLLQGYGPRQIDYKTGGPGILENYYTPELLHAAFKSLKDVEIADYDTDLSEGSAHRGRSHLVELIGRKASLEP